MPYHPTMPNDTQSTPAPHEPNEQMHFNHVGNSTSSLAGAMGDGNQPNETDHAAFPGSMLHTPEIPGLLGNGS